jgi:hypothetical protein
MRIKTKIPLVSTGTKGTSAVPPCFPTHTITPGRSTRANGRTRLRLLHFTVRTCSENRTVGEFCLNVLRWHFTGLSPAPVR